MALDREPIYVALATRLTGLTGVVTFSRRFRDVSKVTPAEMPALFLVMGDETPMYKDKHLPPTWVLEPGIFLYVRTEDENQAPSTIINGLLLKIDTALEFQAGDAPAGQFAPTTLGKLVSHCRIAKTDVWEGTGKDSGWGGAILHLHILAPGPA